MMILNQKQLDLIEEYSGLFLNMEEISILLDVEYDSFRRTANNKKTDIYRAYMRGRTNAKLEIRRNVIDLAKAGSPQAEVLADKYITEQRVAENG
jgi:hypothetical protein